MARQYVSRYRGKPRGRPNYWNNFISGARFAWRHRNRIVNAGKEVGRWISSKRKAGGQLPAPKVTKKQKLTTNKFKQSLQGTSQHNDTSQRYFRCVVRKGRRGVIQKLMRQKHHFKYTEDWNGVFSSGEGRQGYTTLKCIGTKNQVGAQNIINTRAGVIAAISSARPYYELNPYRTTTGSSIFAPGNAGVTIDNDKIYYKSISGTLKVINLKSLATHITIYWMMCKKNTYYSVEDLWTRAIADEGMTGSAAVPTGTLGVPTANAGVPIAANIGQNPFMYRAFKAHWRVLEKKTAYLQGGDEIDFNFRFEYNKLLDKAVFSEDSAEAVFLANYTIVPFMIFKGSLAGITSAVGTPATEVSIGAAKLGVYINQTHEFGPVPAELRTPTTQYFPGALEGTNTEVQIDDTDEVDIIETA